MGADEGEDLWSRVGMDTGIDGRRRETGKESGEELGRYRGDGSTKVCACAPTSKSPTAAWGTPTAQAVHIEDL